MPFLVLSQALRSEIAVASLYTSVVLSDDRDVTVSLAAKSASGSFRDIDINFHLDVGHDIDSADLAYLQAKGVFTLPPTEVCDRLIRGFMSHIHPWYPVIDVSQFLARYKVDAPNRSDLMLLWSVLLAGIECAEPDLVSSAGFCNKQKMADSYYSCAKVLYDMNGLRDRETCTQVMLLLSRYHKDLVKRWHAVATSKWLCQFMMTGFNTAPEYQPRLSPHTKALWNRRWWCCLANDVWVAVNTGWPLKIAASDAHTTALSATDILTDVEILESATRQLYVPDTISSMAEHIVSYNRSVAVLRAALASADKSNDKISSVVEVGMWARELVLIEQETAPRVAQDMASLDNGLKLTAFRSHIYQTGMQAALLRPYLFVSPSHLLGNKKSAWDSEMKQMMISVAAKMTSAFETLISAQLACFLGQGPINALTPVAQYYLVHITAGQEAERRMAQNKLDSCIIILEEMQKADGYVYGYLKIFKDARRSVLSNEGQGVAAPLDHAISDDQDPAFVDWNEFLWKDWDAALAAGWDDLSPMAIA